MGFWSNVFGWGKSTLKDKVDDILEEAREAVYEEIDKHSGTSDEEKAFMKRGVDLLAERAEDYVKNRL